MKHLYLVQRTDQYSYDEFDSFIVCAESSQKARNIKPVKLNYGSYDEYDNDSWIKDDEINTLKVTLIGNAHPKIKIGCILASFNAG